MNARAPGLGLSLAGLIRENSSSFNATRERSIEQCANNHDCEANEHEKEAGTKVYMETNAIDDQGEDRQQGLNDQPGYSGYPSPDDNPRRELPKKSRDTRSENEEHRQQGKRE